MTGRSFTYNDQTLAHSSGATPSSTGRGKQTQTCDVS